MYFSELGSRHAAGNFMSFKEWPHVVAFPGLKKVVLPIMKHGCSTQWRSQGGGHQGHGPSQRQIRGAIISFAPPKQPMGPHGRMGPWPLFACHEAKKTNARY